MLGSASYYYANPGNTATQTLSLSGLTIDQAYQIRLWAADYRPAQSGRTETVGGLTLDYDDGSGSYSGGNYVIGTFAADADTSQAFTLTSGASPSRPATRLPSSMPSSSPPFPSPPPPPWPVWRVSVRRSAAAAFTDLPSHGFAAGFWIVPRR